MTGNSVNSVNFRRALYSHIFKRKTDGKFACLLSFYKIVRQVLPRVPASKREICKLYFTLYSCENLHFNNNSFTNIVNIANISFARRENIAIVFLLPGDRRHRVSPRSCNSPHRRLKFFEKFPTL